MPTPSAREGPGSASFNATCPDDQAPRVSPDWAHYRLPTYEEIAPDTDGAATASGIRSGTTSAAATGIGTGAGAGAGDTSGAAGSGDGGATTVINADTGHLPSPPFTAASEARLASGTEADEDAKPAETDYNMAEGSSAPSGQSAGQARGAPLAGSSGSSISAAGARPGRRYVAPLEGLETMGLNQALRRQLDLAALAGYSSRQYSIPDTAPALSPVVTEEQPLVDNMSWVEDQPTYLDCDPTSYRVIPTTPSTYLRPGSRFEGTQQSERQRYDVQVEIKHVDLRESFLCGYLRIQGLTDDHPTLTTYFEGEIIGSKYGFNTKHASWGANDRIDMSHWAKFPAFRQFAKQAKKGNFLIKEHLQKENIFMRWKEHFLVPDHRVRTIHGASFEGFYYICFNQVEGVVHGIYFHSKSEKFQQLELKHVNNRGCMSAVEFR